MEAKSDEVLTPQMRRLLGLSVSGVFLDGYDISIISLALLQIGKTFHATPTQIGLVASAILVGNFVGALVFGRLADRLGRRLVFIADVVFFVVFAILSGLSFNVWQLILWRFLIGIGIGGDYALASPIIAEAVPAKRRGRILVLNWGGAWFAGEIAAFAVGYLFLHFGSGDAWRWMLASGALPAIVVLLLRRNLPESARWLLAQGREDEAHAAAGQLGTSLGAMVDFSQRAAVLPSSHALSEIFGKFARNTWYGILNYVFEGAPFYALSVFLPLILTKSGFSKTPSGIALGNLALQATGIIGLVLIYTWVDTRGRRFVNYLGYGGIVLALLIYELLFRPSLPAIFILFILIEIALWLGPASTDNLLLGELWPTRIRGTGAGIGAAAGRLSAIFGTYTMPVLIASFGVKGALILPLVFSAFGIIVTAVIGVETKGKTLEELWGH
ncbi:MFS transporter [Acidiphilium sp. AL]|uniref:MFS transporter n=1 Tax=Acidiphilium sp. AL TaxID=2871704 RepID=UPI0021CAE4EE|nr:MFS transporter [Acidiphilium sp. AL]MCU4161828.1 MFS transporter [Acidiphilium sp. AL]